MKKLMLIGVAALICLAPVAAYGISYDDYGNGSSSALTTEAWDKYAAGQYGDAIELTDACIYLYGTIADTQQGVIVGDYFNSREPVAGTGDDDVVFSNWALNDVGTCWFIRALSEQKLGNSTEAKNCLKEITNEKDRSQTVHEAYIDAFAIDLGPDEDYGTADDFFWSIGKGAKAEKYKIDGNFPSPAGH